MAAAGLGLSLREEVQGLRKRGESLGLTKAQIDDAILAVLGEKIGTPAHEHIKKQHHHWSCLRKLAYFTLCGVFLLIGVGVACNYNQQCSLYASQTMADISYPLIRIIRFVALPIHKFHDMSFMNKWDCIIDNPLYVPAKPECVMCEEVNDCPIHPSTNLTKQRFKKKFYDSAIPVVIRDVPGYLDENHTFEELQELYKANKEELEKDICEFYAARGRNSSEFKSLEELMEKWDHYKAEGEVTGWKICYGKGMRAIRGLYPRPYFIHSEGSLDKSLYLLQPGGDSAKTQIIDMPPAFYENIWVAQVTGSTQLDLVPVEDCKDRCKTQTITLIKGDILYYTQHVWTASFKNVGSEPAILFSSSFA